MVQSVHTDLKDLAGALGLRDSEKFTHSVVSGVWVTPVDSACSSGGGAQALIEVQVDREFAPTLSGDQWRCEWADAPSVAWLHVDLRSSLRVTPSCFALCFPCSHIGAAL